MKKQLQAVPLRSEQFTWSETEDGLKFGSSDASDLGWWGYPQLVRVRSSKTGKVVSFSRIASRRDAEQEILAYRYWNAEVGVGLEVWND